MESKYVYTFGRDGSEGDRFMRDILGGKGANLAEMSRIGLPVPPGFTISTKACAFYHERNHMWPAELKKQVESGIRFLEKSMSRKFGDPKNPLLVSVRSGAAASMPGMMDTVLNLGLSDESTEGLAELTGNERFAYDSYRRFIDMFADVVMGIPHLLFEHAMDKLKEEKGATSDADLNAHDLRELVDRYKAIYRKQTGYMFPNDPWEQLHFSINAVFKSWNSDRANKYRAINKITGLIGTAVNIQAMVFGNMGDNSGSGVCFTRNPSNGDKVLYGEFLRNAQGEDVVAGIRTPEPIARLQDEMPDMYHKLNDVASWLENHYKDMQDIEFTIQEGVMYILQTRSGKRTGAAAIKVAVDFVTEKLVSKKHAVAELVKPHHIEQLLHPQFADNAFDDEDILGTGLPASPGAAVGKVYFTSQKAEDARKNGEKVILVRIETSPEDVGGMDASEGILTSRGGMTSHAAVVARGWGKPCVVGCNDIVINYANHSMTNGTITIHEGDWISINGNSGEVVQGEIPLIESSFSKDFEKFMHWADEFRKLGVRANADRPEDAERAREYGAAGIGLCRTEHMFFQGSRIEVMREMILAENEEQRRAALDKLFPYQKEDFAGIFRAVGDNPVTIRLLDPPLHEFLPKEKAEIKRLAEELGVSEARIRAKVVSLEEVNPMLGHRGCRLGVTFPEITEMQTRAIIEAALDVKREGIQVQPEIMIPLVGIGEEFRNQERVIHRVADEIFKRTGETIGYLVGTMIEIPRAAIMAGEIAENAQFFSFGTNDLTQTTFGFSRDDSGKFLPYYIDQKILTSDPFQSLDIHGVGELIRVAVERGHRTRRKLKTGICGEHGGDPDSVHFCHDIGLDYVSCSPFRVPIARLAAAQAALMHHDLAELVSW